MPGMKEYLDNNQLVKATDTNWMDEIFRTAVSTNHQLTISNGSDKAKSLFSLGYTNNQGTQIHGAPDKPCGVGRADANPKLLLNDT